MDVLEENESTETIKAPCFQVSDGVATVTAKNPAVDNCDKPKIGEILNSRYTINAYTGKGAFSYVIRAVDSSCKNSLVAIKILRKQFTDCRSTLKEVKMLCLLNNADPDDKYHCLRFFTHFYHKKRLCIVIQPLHKNLRQILKENGAGLGIKIVWSYSQQLLSALHLLKRCGIMHADIKPDNIMVDQSKSVLKLCDFGSATFISETFSTPYVVTPYYRAPEIILGLECDFGIDMWSVGCTLYELCTHKKMFRGESNDELLKLFTELKGEFSNELICKGLFHRNYFDRNFNFLGEKVDPITGSKNIVAKRNLLADLLGSQHLSLRENVKVLHLSDMLHKIFTLDPFKRISLEQVLEHPFIIRNKF